MELSERERITVLMMRGFGDRSRSYEEVKNLFNDTFPDRIPISKSVVYKTVNRFEETGSVSNRLKPGRPKSATNEETSLDVLQSVVEDPHVSAGAISLNLGISHRSVLRTLHQNDFKPYKIHLVQELSEDDFDRRIEFGELMMNHIDRNTIRINDIVFSDEATFMLNGNVNRHNCRFWSDVNPHWVREQHTQHPQKLNVWLGIVAGQFVGPFFIDGSLNADVYRRMLEGQIVPAVQASCINFDRVWFQQDGAPPHYGRYVREYLDIVFPNRWIGRRGAIEWPARSPDLSPLDYFVWGHIKAVVYKNKPESIEDLRGKIIQAVRSVPQESLLLATSAFYTRLGHCQAVQGQQFEHLL